MLLKKISLYFPVLMLIQFSLFAQDDNSPVIISEPDNSALIFSEIKPEFINYRGQDSEERIKNFISDSLRRPTGDKCSGNIFIRFIVESDGSLSDIKIMKGLSCPEYNEEVLRVAKLFPEWQPGKNNGKPVRVFYTIRVNFP
jgi:hypothetical protein